MAPALTDITITNTNIAGTPAEGAKQFGGKDPTSDSPLP